MFPKLLSGRFILTVTAAIVFLYLCIKGTMEPKDALQIITMVFVLYFANGPKSDNQKPGPGAIATVLVFFLAIVGTANAETILDEVRRMPNLKPGIAYSIVDQKVNFLSTLEITSYKDISIEAGYAGTQPNTGDKAVVVVSYDLLNLSKIGVKTPVLDLIDIRVGAYAGIGRIEAGTAPVMRGNNEFDYGVSATAVTIKF
jgi:hypothetical protein